MCTTTVDSGWRNMPDGPPRGTSPRLARTSSLRRILASFPGLRLLRHITSRRKPLPGEPIPSSKLEPSRDTLYTASTAGARLPTKAASSPIKVLRRAISLPERPKQPPTRDRDAIIERARIRSRRRSDAADGWAAIEESTALAQGPCFRRTNSV